MKIIAHISDPHFGSEDPIITAALLDELRGVTAPAPALVAISGDLTQRARDDQFCAARGFLDRLTSPYVVVPGNHDVPLYDVVSRFLHPLRRYRRHITTELMPRYLDDDLAVVGLTTAHGFTRKGGKVTEAQARAAAAIFAAAGDRFKLVVAHHPFALPAGSDAALVVGAERALPILEAAGVAALCTGHLHIAHSSDTIGFRTDDRAVVAIHAGTCTSTRRRGEPNGYNRLLIDGDRLTIQQRHWDDAGRWVDGPCKAYRRGHAGHWRRAVDPAA